MNRKKGTIQAKKTGFYQANSRKRAKNPIFLENFTLKKISTMKTRLPIVIMIGEMIADHKIFKI